MYNINIDNQDKLFLKSINLDCFGSYNIDNKKLIIKNKGFVLYLLKTLKRYKHIIDVLIIKLEGSYIYDE